MEHGDRRMTRTALFAGLVLLGLIGREATAQTQGTVLRATVADASNGVLLTGAEVTVRGLALNGRTDILGDAWIAGVSGGVHTVQARLLGYEPASVRAQFSGNDSLEVLLLLVPVSQELPPVTITDSIAFVLHEFEKRRQRGMGHYITQTELRAAHGRAFADIVMSKIPGVRIGPTGIVYSTRGPNSVRSGLCPVAVWYNGVRGAGATDFRSGGGADLVSIGLLGGIEYYTPGYVPVQYRDGAASCGVMLIWSGF